MRATLKADRMLTPPQVAERLAVHPEKVLRWIRSGKLPAINVTEKEFGRPRFRVKPADLEAFVASLSVFVEPEPTPRRRPMPDHVIEFY